jgi:diguanylate cyclase (GGDEF)-like protein
VARRRVPASGRPPRLVLRFAVFTSVGLALAGALILLVVRHGDTVQAERNVIDRAHYITEVVLARELREGDLRPGVSRARRLELDRIFRRLLLDGTLRATLYTADGTVTFSTDPRLVGRRFADSARLDEALAGSVVAHVRPAKESMPRMLETLVPIVLGDDRVAGAVALEHDYEPIAAAADEAFFPIAGVLEAVLLLLLIVLVPVLARVSARIGRHVAELEHTATHDELTGLPNRLGFRRMIEAGLREATPPAPVWVLVLDIDGFGEINDALGHASGDLLLSTAAERLHEEFGEAARCGADEFGVVLHVASLDEARQRAERARHLLALPHVLAGVKVALDASVGMALAPEHGNDADTLFRRAVVAADLARERRSGVELYDPMDDASDVARLALAAELREAIAERQLVVHYQPQLDLATGTIRGVEALVRWQHPERGLLGPGAFVPIAEGSGLVKELGRFVLDSAVRQLREWNEVGIALDVSVNLTAVDLLDLSLPDEVASAFERHELPCRHLVLELTESTLMTDERRTGAVLARLADLGVRLAIDDFGTGYSSLAYLQSLPVHEVKIDRGFVAGIPAHAANASIVRWTIELAHSLGLQVVAEGVETHSQLDYLKALGCDVVQGYMIRPPVAAEEIVKLVRGQPAIAA